MIASVAGGELTGFANIGYGGQLHWVERTIVNWVLKRAHRVTVGSRYLQEIAARWRGDAQIAPLGVDSEIFSPRAKPVRQDQIRIINVASLLPVKQQEILLEAIARLKSYIELEIVGSGERQQFLQRRASELKISHRVKFSGEVAHAALPQKYRAADIFAQASWHEAQGIAVLEAAACGLTIAGTPVGVLPELAKSHRAIAAHGFGAPALAAAIERAIESRQELGCRARAMAEQEFSLPVSQARWMNLYHSLT
jgi:glycosyltransferase involved in cell wall biosynthesis